MGTPNGSTVMAVVTTRKACLYRPYCSRPMRRTSNKGNAMLKTKPTLLANVSHETRHVSDSFPVAARPVRVLLIAPSLNIIGGQSIQASQLLRRLRSETDVQVRFLPTNPGLPAALRIQYVRTVITLVLYLARLAAGINRCDVLHIFTPGYISFYLHPAPALILARIAGK